jgi:pimeloyl-ACP methyl ester carboxylesterase
MGFDRLRGGWSRRVARIVRAATACKIALGAEYPDHANSIPPALMKEMYLVGNRPGHYRAFLSLLRNAASWETATQDYGRIETPVLLIWGDRDWAKPSEREHDRKLIPSVEMTTLKNGGHFLPLDRPRELTAGIARFVSAPAPVNKR